MKIGRSVNPSSAEHGDTPEPKRVLGLRDLVMFYVVATLSLRWIPVAASAGPSTLVIWLIGLTAIFIPLALCVLELSSRYPQEGGMYVWSKRAFGDFAGFLTGWIYWTSNLPYFPALLYFAASNALYVGGSKWKGLQGSAGFFMAFSLLGLGLALALNIVGLDIGKWLSNLGAIGTWLPVALLCVAGVIAWTKFGPATSFSAASMKPSLHWGTIAVWSALLSAFSGAESASFMGGEIKDARRTIPRALLVAGVLITTGYMLGTAAVLVVLPHSQLNSLEGIMQTISISAERVGWSGLGPAVALLICISNLGAVGAYLAALSRIPFVAGIDRFLPPAFGRVHPKWRTPYVSLIAQALCCVLFIVLGQLGSTVHGAYQVLVSMTIITTFVPYLFMFAAMIRLQREPVEPGVVRVPGGKPVAIVLAAVGFVTTCAVIVGSMVPDASEPNKLFAVGKIIGLSAVLLGAGVGLYWMGKRRAKVS
ncbi:MAG: APC family permease [Candidatus Korobacteraceae bacterium]|jgi:amino acid transporter